MSEFYYVRHTIDDSVPELEGLPHVRCGGQTLTIFLRDLCSDAEIQLNSRGNKLTLTPENGSGEKNEISAFPASVRIDMPGTYRIDQTGHFGQAAPGIQFYVKIPAAESNTQAVMDSLPDPFIKDNELEFFNDLLTYLAAAIVALLFIEWILQLRDNM